MITTMSYKDAGRMFSMAVLASATGQHDKVAFYAGQALAARTSKLVQVSQVTFNRLTASYKYLMDQLQNGWQTIDRRPGFEEGGDGNQTLFLAEYKRQLAHETAYLCRDFCAIVDRHLLPGLSEPSAKAHAFKLKADFYRSAKNNHFK